MNKAIESIKQYMEHNNFQCELEKLGETIALASRLNINSSSTVMVLFYSADGKNDVSICAVGIVNSIPEDKMDAMLREINACTNRYNYIRFCISGEGRLDAEYDIPQAVTDDCIGAAGVEMYVRMAQVINECYPGFMKALWSA